MPSSNNIAQDAYRDHQAAMKAKTSLVVDPKLKPTVKIRKGLEGKAFIQTFSVTMIKVKKQGEGREQSELVPGTAVGQRLRYAPAGEKLLRIMEKKLKSMEDEVGSNPENVTWKEIQNAASALRENFELAKGIFEGVPSSITPESLGTPGMGLLANAPNYPSALQAISKERRSFDRLGQLKGHTEEKTVVSTIQPNGHAAGVLVEE